MTPRVAVEETRGPVLAGLVAPSDADDVLARALPEAAGRGTTLTVLAAGAAAAPDRQAEFDEVVARWAGKFPGVTVAVTRQPTFDPAIALTAATAGCVMAVVARPAAGRAAAIVDSLLRRAHCPVVVEGDVR